MFFEIYMAFQVWNIEAININNTEFILRQKFNLLFSKLKMSLIFAIPNRNLSPLGERKIIDKMKVMKINSSA